MVDSISNEDQFVLTRISSEQGSTVTNFENNFRPTTSIFLGKKMFVFSRAGCIQIYAERIWNKKKTATHIGDFECWILKCSFWCKKIEICIKNIWLPCLFFLVRVQSTRCSLTVQAKNGAIFFFNCSFVLFPSTDLDYQ